MIFADKLIDLRKKNGWSQEELAEKLEVSRQTISKWEGALSMPDLGRMLKIAQLFGVSTDYLIKDDQELADYADSVEEDEGGDQVRRVSMEQAVEFLRLRDTMGSRVALGVLLCIYCSIPLVLLSGAQETGRLAVSENVANGLGCLILFLMVAAAVGIFIYSGMKLRDYEFLENESIETVYGVDSMVRERQDRYAPRHTQLIIIGIVLCVLCPTPLFGTMVLLGEENEWAMTLASAALLAIVGIGVLCIVRTCMVWGAFQQLLEEENYTREHKREQRLNGAISGVYWGLATAIFLGYSFITEDWGRSWIVWPVAGVCYGVLVSILRVIRKGQK